MRELKLGRSNRNANDPHELSTNDGVAEAIMPGFQNLANLIAGGRDSRDGLGEFLKEQEEQRHKRSRAEALDKNKSGGQNKRKATLQEVMQSTQRGKSLKRLCTDNGGDYISIEFRKHLLKYACYVINRYPLAPLELDILRKFGTDIICPIWLQNGKNVQEEELDAEDEPTLANNGDMPDDGGVE
ncbi:hypothetical protein RJ639_021847 [Escallonia herrerae]|uniref:Uncharacterized protein n=1 Tax=Escallonia herrerae TaxID=1293975 RepID=A0AA89AG42_9ASTE|nr:hypothetical protein RJ639_021847 [Escallonia herrerae]